VVSAPVAAAEYGVVPGRHVRRLDHGRTAGREHPVEPPQESPRVGNVLDDLLQDGQREEAVSVGDVLESSADDLQAPGPRPVDRALVELHAVELAGGNPALAENPEEAPVPAPHVEDVAGSAARVLQVRARRAPVEKRLDA